MKKLVKAFLIGAIVMIVLGIGLCAGGVMAAGGFKPAMDSFIRSQGTENSVGTTASEVFSDAGEITFGQEDVKSLKIDVGAAEAEITENDSAKEFCIRTDGNYEIYVRNGILHIEAKKNLDDHKLLLEIPGDFVFEDVEISAGACEIDIHQIESKEFDVEVGAGQVKIGNLVADKAEFEIGAGEILVGYGNVSECDVNVGMGNFEYTGMVLNHGDVECSMGNVEFHLEKGVEEYNFEIECGAGSVDIGNQSFSGLGTEKFINNQVQEQFNIECSMGSVTVNAEN